jgi:hypothetical protein
MRRRTVAAPGNQWWAENMSRSEVPVSADWVEENLNTPGIVLAEADEGGGRI